MLLRHIRYFLAVAEHGGFTPAAQALHVSQPTLSQQIKQLEERLGAQLFERGVRHTLLTDAGKAYLTWARRALSDLDAGERAIHDVQSLNRGSLRIGMTPTFTAFLVGPLLAAFYQRYPNITLRVAEMSQDEIEKALIEDGLDIGIAFDERGSPDIEVQPLLEETLALVVGQSHPAAGQKEINLAALGDEHLVLLSEAFATRGQIDSYCRQHDIRLQVAIEVNSIGAVTEIVQRTHLATLLPMTIAQQHSALTSITLKPTLLQRTAVLLQRKGGWQTAAARAFITLAHQQAQAMMTDVLPD
ncbi:HTH-type transcriptional regulator CynR [Paramixta manurensis]|uniref:HTH-type transcriptional regulator CynR n=1 Tax=Paramixta manurensis TaxID=2740817 RepID=A0A6M8UGR4_9GAMM|nr:HTH-type transcriptional regulator CynR [Erwiniaceae bacterium PD-1]